MDCKVKEGVAEENMVLKNELVGIVGKRQMQRNQKKRQ